MLKIFFSFFQHKRRKGDHKTSHKGQFVEMICRNYLKIWNLRVHTNQNIEKIVFKVVQIKFLAMHITYKNFSFDIYTVRRLQNIFMEHYLYLILHVCI